MKTNLSFYAILLWSSLLLFGCDKDNEKIEPIDSIVYKLDGRSVKYGDSFPIALDMTEDGQVDFTIFVELTANSNGDRLYAGINPIGANLIKSGPPNYENFLSMGLLVAETPGKTIDSGIGQNQIWTSDHNALVIRNAFSNGEVSYEGSWTDSEQMVGVQHIIGESIYFGWIRIKFDKATEIVTLIDYAFNSIPSQEIKAGATSN